MPEPVNAEWLAEVRERSDEYRAALTELFDSVRDDRPAKGIGIINAATHSADDVPALIRVVVRFTRLVNDLRTLAEQQCRYGGIRQEVAQHVLDLINGALEADGGGR